MRVFIILASIALAHGAKLERTYLPPSHARTSGGSGNFLQTPISTNTQNGLSNGFSQNNDFTQSGNGFSEIGNEFSQNGNDFSQSGNGFSQNGNGFSQTANGFSQTGINIQQEAFPKNVNFNNFGNFEARPERAQAALERNAAILRQDNSNDGETFAYAYETENGIYAEENGVATNGVEAQGGYSYTGDDGQVYSIRYTADQNGFVPQGDHIPTPPPVPEEILKALEQNARDEAAGIFDDGSYNEGKYSNTEQQNYQQQNYQQQNYQQQNYQQNAFNGNDEDTVATNAAFTRNYPTDLDTPKTTGSFGVRGSSNYPTDLDTPRAVGLTAARVSGVEKAYLPPFTRGNGFGRRPSFDSRNGYRY